jgi:hypothetical protein
MKNKAALKTEFNWTNFDYQAPKQERLAYFTMPAAVQGDTSKLMRDSIPSKPKPDFTVVRGRAACQKHPA